VQVEQKPAICEQHGEYVSVPSICVTAFGKPQSWSRCPACEAERAAERAAAAEVARRTQREYQLRPERAGIPERFIGKGFESYHATTAAQKRVLEVCRDYADRFTDHLNDGRCLTLLVLLAPGKLTWRTPSCSNS
jgi:DNA replication protein DnaC